MKRTLTLSERGRRAGKARLRTMSPKERQRVARVAALARWARTSPAQRRRIARRTVLARWAKTPRRARH